LRRTSPIAFNSTGLSKKAAVANGHGDAHQVLVGDPAGTQVLVRLAHPTPYVSFDTVLVWPGGNSASFPVQTYAEPYQLGIAFYADVGSQRYLGNGFTLYPAQAPPPPPPPTVSDSVWPGSLTFGPQAPGTVSPPKTVTVKNTGNETLPVYYAIISVTGPFKLTSNACPVYLASGASCTVSVAYAPTTGGGAQSGSLTIQTSAPSSPHVIPLSGTPTPWISVTPGAVGFGSVALGNATSGRVVKVTSTGTAPLVVSSLSVGGTNAGDFPIWADGCTGATLSPGASCTAYVSFEPLGIGARTATITITHNASGGPQLVGLSGTGVKSSGYIP